MRIQGFAALNKKEELSEFQYDSKRSYTSNMGSIRINTNYYQFQL